MAVVAGWSIMLVVLTGAGIRQRVRGRRPNRPLRIARRVLLFQFVLVALAMSVVPA